ncbi:MAG: DNA polymerase III subunit [Clostridia bacterium]|nr:DNA polymerase III subunit [Clostridia bacterium]
MMFENVVGHTAVKERLEGWFLADKVSHAYIFSGKRGVGKTTMARAFAQLLTNGSAADIIHITNEHYGIDSKTDIVAVDTIRAAAADMYMKPYFADKRVFIISSAEKMNVQAQNALLKIFEEPPAYCVIILVTQNDNMLLQTIRSRAITVRFSALEDSLVKDYVLKQGINAPEVVIRLSSGSIGTALELGENQELHDVLDTFVGMFKNIGNKSAYSVYSLIDYLQREKKNYEVLFDIMLIMLKDSLPGNKSELSIQGLNNKKVVRIIELVENTRNSFSFNADYNMAVSEMMLNILGEVNG